MFFNKSVNYFCRGLFNIKSMWWYLSDLGWCARWGLRASIAGVPYAKFLAFGTPNPKIWASWGVSNTKNFGTPLQYHLKYEPVQTTIEKIYILFYLLYLSLSLSQISLSLRLLISVFSIPLPQHADHQRPPFDAVDHLFTLFRFGFFFFLFFSFFLFLFFFSFTFLGCGLIGGLGNGWVWMGRSMVGGFWCRSLCFLLFLFFYGGGFGVLLWWF